MVHGRSAISGVKTGGAAPGFGGGVVRLPVERACCALDIPASAAAPAPSPRTLLKKLLRGFINGISFASLIALCGTGILACVVLARLESKSTRAGMPID